MGFYTRLVAAAELIAGRFGTVPAVAGYAQRLIGALEIIASGWAAFHKYVGVCVQSASVSEASSTGNVDVPGMVLTLPRAGTYWIDAILFSADNAATSNTVKVGVAYSGTTTNLALQTDGTFQSGGTASGAGLQTTAGTLPVGKAAAATNGHYWRATGTITVSTAGNLKFQVARSATTMTVTNSAAFVREA